MKLIFKNLKLLLILLISSIIIFSWFKEGKMISNGSEEDLNVYHSQRSAERFSGAWDSAGTGNKTAYPIARSLAFFILGFLEQQDVPGYLRQAILLYFLMTVGVISMYLLIKEVFGMSRVISLIGSFFYLLNIYSMTQVWKRFLYHGIFAWAYLPLFLFLWIKWITGKKLIWLLIFLLTSEIFAYSFSQPANLLTIWTPAVIFTLVQIWKSENTQEKIRIIIKSAIAFILWFAINIWWLYPTLTLGSSWTSQLGQTWQSDLSSLHAVSKYFPIWEVLLLRQSWYLGHDNDWFDFYHNPFVILVSILVLFIVVLGIIKNRGYKYWSFLIITGFIGLFISKGTNFPFGYTFFNILFSKFTLTTALRNSYEKFGLVWLLAYTIFFAFGIPKFLSLFNLKLRNFYAAGILLLVFGILVNPFWIGSIFPSPHRLNAPKYYKEANDYINSKYNHQNSNRIFHIPFLIELERVIYSWGYVGEDPSPSLFDKESITTPKTPFYYEISKLLPNFLNDRRFPRLLGLFSVENVILHKDNVYPKINIEETDQNLDNWEGIIAKKEIQDLVVYSLKQELVRPRIYIASSITHVESLEEGLIKIISNTTTPDGTIFTLDQISSDYTNPRQRLPKLSFKKISKEHYIANIKESKTPFILILNNTFDKAWQLKIDNQLTGKHFIVNAFANGWIVERNGDFKVDIKLKVWPWE